MYTANGLQVENGHVLGPKVLNKTKNKEYEPKGGDVSRGDRISTLPAGRSNTNVS
jgi:hypothetical protein